MKWSSVRNKFIYTQFELSPLISFPLNSILYLSSHLIYQIVLTSENPSLFFDLFVSFDVVLFDVVYKDFTLPFKISVSKILALRSVKPMWYVLYKCTMKISVITVRTNFIFRFSPLLGNSIIRFKNFFVCSVYRTFI